MVYSSRTDPYTYAPDPVRIQRRDAERASRDTNIAAKIKEFIQEQGFFNVVAATCTLHDDRKVMLGRDKDLLLLLVQHRGHQLQVSCTSVDAADKLEAELRAWCKKELPHAKVFPRKR